MALTPFSRERMRMLKSEKDAELQGIIVEKVVTYIYSYAVNFAEKNSETRYRIDIHTNGCFGSISLKSSSPLKHEHWNMIKPEDIVRNMDEILARLRVLFPDCSVEYKKLSFIKGADGKDYDVLTLDDNARPFIDMTRAKTDEYVIIDWS